MNASQDVHEFAVKWFDLFRNTKITIPEIEASAFADECFSLGFHMDCGKALKEAYPESNAFNDFRELDKIIEGIDDVPLLGSAIFSKWRDITHWAGPDEANLSLDHRSWFITALSRLERLTAGMEETPFLFAGTAKKVKIISNSICYGPCPAPEDEVEQRLTITADGRVFFSAYNFGDGKKYRKSRTRNFKINSNKASYILGTIADYFSDDYDVALVTDVGDWEMTLTNEDGAPYRFRGSLCVGCLGELDDVSDILRFQLDMPELLAFDGCSNLDRIERIAVEYHRETRIKPKVLPEGAT